MENFSIENYPILIGFGVFAVVLIGWMIYRNLKDEDEFEHNLDDPKRDLEKHDKGEKT